MRTAVRTLETVEIGSPGRAPAKGVGRACVTPMTGLGLSDDELRSGLPPARVWAVLVRVTDAEGREGIGTAGFPTSGTAAIIRDHLAPLVLGVDPSDTELTWERMYRSTLNVGRKGVVVAAISAVDIALWDLAAKALDVPLYALLGGRTRDRIRVYASRLYATEDLDALELEASAYVERGFTAVKQRLASGPTDGPAGMRRNLQLVRGVSRAIGPDVEHMVDAYMGWDRDYAVRMIRMIEDDGIRLRWVEEPLRPDDVDGYAKVRAAIGTPLAAGEHEFTRHGARDLIERGGIDVLQPDVNRVGGITEARKVWALAAAHDVPVVPHAGQMHNYHLVMAHVNSPMAEHFIRPPEGVIPDEDELFYRLFANEPDAIAGMITLDPDAPGLGLELDEDYVSAHRIGSHRLEADGSAA